MIQPMKKNEIAKTLRQWFAMYGHRSMGWFIPKSTENIVPKIFPCQLCPPSIHLPYYIHHCHYCWLHYPHRFPYNSSIPICVYIIIYIIVIVIYYIDILLYMWMPNNDPEISSHYVRQDIIPNRTVFKKSSVIPLNCLVKNGSPTIHGQK